MQASHYSNFRRYGIMGVVISLCFTMMPITMLAASYQPEIKLNQISGKIENLQHNLQQDKTKRRQLKTELQTIEIKLGQINKVLDETTQQVVTEQKQLAALSFDQGRYQQQLKQQRYLLMKQVNFAYRLGKYEYIKLLLNQEQLSSFGRSFVYFDYFNHARLELMQQLTQTVQQLAAIQEKMQTHSQAVVELQQKKQQQQHDLLQARQDRQQVVGTLTQQIQDQDQHLTSLLADKQALEVLIQQLERAAMEQKQVAASKAVSQQAAVSTEMETEAAAVTTEVNNRALPLIQRRLLLGQAFTTLQGKLPWPIDGEITKHFGSAMGSGRLFYNGVLIKAEPGQAVHAISDGKVVFADWLSGFGLLVIVQHSDNYMTLYGHNQSLYKKVGSQVAAGDLLATVGNSGGYFQSGLYFEIRRNGKPVNPERWCSKNIGVWEYASR